MSLPNVSHIVTHRNRLGVWLANQALRLTTDEYQGFVRGSIEYGLRAAARDKAEGREPPPSWRREQAR